MPVKPVLGKKIKIEKCVFCFSLFKLRDVYAGRFPRLIPNAGCRFFYARKELWSVTFPLKLFNDGRGSLENNLAFPRFLVAFGHFTSVVVKEDHP